MKITVQTNFGMHKNKMPDSAVTAYGSRSGEYTARTDRDSITRGHTTVSNRQMLLLKSSVQDYVSSPADGSRLDRLRETIQNGTYHVPTDTLVAAILADE